MRKVLNVYFKVLDEKTRPIYEQLRKARYANIKCWLRKEDAESKSIRLARDLRTIEDRGTNNELVCYQWNICDTTVTPEYDGLQHLMERTLNQQLEFVCIDNVIHAKECLVLFQDAKHCREYPMKFVKVPCFNTYQDLIAHAEELGIFDFSLEDTNRFEKCIGIRPVQGAYVYREKSTKLYWYKDMLHKTHYEVFDKEGRNHIGEADMCGNLDITKQDKSKHPITKGH